MNAKHAVLAIDKVTYVLELSGLGFIRTDSVTKAENLNKMAKCVPAQCLINNKTPEAKLHLSVNFSMEYLILSIKSDTSGHRLHYGNNINNNKNAYDSSVSHKMY
jgi:hypothetical protein